MYAGFPASCLTGLVKLVNLTPSDKNDSHPRCCLTESRYPGTVSLVVIAAPLFHRTRDPRIHASIAAGRDVAGDHFDPILIARSQIEIRNLPHPADNLFWIDKHPPDRLRPRCDFDFAVDGFALSHDVHVFSSPFVRRGASICRGARPRISRETV